LRGASPAQEHRGAAACQTQATARGPGKRRSGYSRGTIDGTRRRWSSEGFPHPALMQLIISRSARADLKAIAHLQDRRQSSACHPRPASADGCEVSPV